MISRKKSQKKVVVDAHLNPTLLFQHINNDDIQGAISRVQSNPEECKIWIVCRKMQRYDQEILHIDENRDSDDGDMIPIWKYLPLHLVCLSIQRYHYQKHREHRHSLHPQDPDNDQTYYQMKQLVNWLVKVYPKAIVVKDYHGNLPIHYLLQHPHLGGQKETAFYSITFDEELFNILMDSKFSNLKKKDGYGRSLQDIINNPSSYYIGSEEEREGINERNEVHNNELKQWIQRLDGELQQLGDISEMTADKEERFNTSWFVHEQQSQQQRQEVDQLHHKCKKLENHASKLELECLSKDDTIDSLSAQIMSLESKVQRIKASQQQQSNKAQQQQQYQQSLSSLYNPKSLQKENISLRKKIELDSKIVSKQHEEIEKLKKKMKDMQKDLENGERRSEEATQRFILFKSDLENNNSDSMSHLRRVTNLLQNEIEAKIKENESLEFKLMDFERQNQALKDKLQDKERAVDRNVKLLEKEIIEQKEVIRILEVSLKKANNHKHNFGAVQTSDDILLGDDQHLPFSADKKHTKIEATANLNEEDIRNKNYLDFEGNDIIGLKATASEQEMHRDIPSNKRDGSETPTAANITKKKSFSLSNSLNNNAPCSIGSDYWNNEKVTEKGSFTTLTEAIESKHQQFGTTDKELGIAHDILKSDEKQMDIEKRQLRLRQDLKDIYKQIKSVLPQENDAPYQPGTVDDGGWNAASQGSNNYPGHKSRSNKVTFSLGESSPRKKERPWRNNHKSTASELGAMILGSSE